MRWPSPKFYLMAWSGGEVNAISVPYDLLFAFRPPVHKLVVWNSFRVQEMRASVRREHSRKNFSFSTFCRFPP